MDQMVVVVDQVDLELTVMLVPMGRPDDLVLPDLLYALFGDFAACFG